MREEKELEMDEKIDSIFQLFDRLFLEGAFSDADKVLEEYHIEDLYLTEIVAILSITNSAKDKLYNRQDFLEKAKKRLGKICPSRVEKLLESLE